MFPHLEKLNFKTINVNLEMCLHILRHKNNCNKLTIKQLQRLVIQIDALKQLAYELNDFIVSTYGV